jgi:hypothetical protein
MRSSLRGMCSEIERAYGATYESATLQIEQRDNDNIAMLDALLGESVLRAPRGLSGVLLRNRG